MNRYHGNVVIGFRNGWQGVLDGNVVEMTPESTRGILHRGGTILGTSRTDPFRIDGGLDLVKENLAAYRMAGLIVVGGEGTLSCAARMADHGINVIADGSCLLVVLGWPPTLSTGCTRRPRATTGC